MYPFQIVPTSRDIFDKLREFCYESIKIREAAYQTDAPNDFIDLYLKKMKESIAQEFSSFKGQVGFSMRFLKYCLMFQFFAAEKIVRRSIIDSN